MTVELANDTRTVQATGSSSYTISLPKKWIDEHGIDAGMELSFYPAHGGELVIKPEPTSAGGRGASDEPRVDIAALSAAEVRQVVGALYATGCEEFVLRAGNGVSSKQRRAAANAASSKTGLEIERESGSEIHFRTVIDTTAVSLERSVLQLQYAALSMQRTVVRVLVDGSFDDLERIDGRYDDAVRRFEVIDGRFRRALADVEELDRLGRSRRAVFDRYTTAGHLLTVTERFQRVADLLRGRVNAERTPWSDEFEDCARRSRTLTESAVDAVLTASRPPYDTAQDARMLAEDVVELHRRANEEDGHAHVWTVALVGLERSATSAAEIAERAVQASLR
ncbi:AbrB/MazE/SpoVT family DNA-binding domain-containing protein [Haladaptatus sp. CMAA 1911]|uniref:AbrB/MazE/SpoVT family DNA-binding domain-containing protein n=1 Tax=unclassified Haladaptatus TaxID=2622732 RepID=UPI0037552632